MNQSIPDLENLSWKFWFRVPEFSLKNIVQSASSKIASGEHDSKSMKVNSQCTRRNLKQN